MNKLSDEQIKQKLIEGRNYKRLYTDHKFKCDETTSQLKQDNTELRQLLSQALNQNQTQAIQIAELQTMVFGKKRKPPTGHYLPTAHTPKLRGKDSYRRPIPPATAITTEVAVPLPTTCACGGNFTQTSLSTHERFTEDIPLPVLTGSYQAKLVTRYLVERGICKRCSKPTSGQELGGAVVSLGSNVRLLVCHLVTTVGLSYAQVAQLLLSLYNLSVTDGELANILRRQHQDWQPAYQELLANIRAAPVVHADETPWPIADLQGHGYAWNMSDAASPKVCYVLANSRGAIHARQLFGSQFTGIRVSDDYGVYRGADFPGQQQLCWAHLYRAIRDLRYNDNLPKEQLPYVSWWYEQFADIYQNLRGYLEQPYDKPTRQQQSNGLWQQLQTVLHPEQNEPQKLTRLKAQLKRAGQAKLFICLTANTPCDNNRAERDLRQLVLKRKRSFGSKTERGAQSLATILSLCTTAWRTSPSNYFSMLATLA
jgi:transposase